jgi:hypothetical protein
LTAGVELYHRMIFWSDDALLRPLLSKRKKTANLQNIRNLHNVNKQLISPG